MQVVSYVVSMVSQYIGRNLMNANLDNSNWADASVSSVYGPGGRGTPTAQNAAFTP